MGLILFRVNCYHAALIRELDGIADQIDEDLLDSARIGCQITCMARHAVGQNHAFDPRLQIEHGRAAFDRRIDFKWLCDEFVAASLNLAHVEHGVDHR